MNRYLAFIIIILSLSINIFGRERIEFALEPALIEVVYECRTALDTLDIENNSRVNLMTLKVGKSTSAFYSAELKYSDSLEHKNREYALKTIEDRTLRRHLARLPKYKVFKNYPEGKIRVHDRYDLCDWIIDEDWENPSWKILTDSVADIMGYQCVLAESKFRGRLWKAWFTFDIPISDGPWKLCGLPGMILRAHDSRMHYVYEPMSVRTEGIGNVVYYDYKGGIRFTTSRLKSLQRKYKSLHEDLHYKMVTSGMYGLSNKSLKKRDKKPHSNYDFEETDYVKPKLE